MDAPHVLATSLRTHWQGTRTALARFVDDADGAGVHELRVRLRRLMSALELASALDAELPRQVQRELKRLLRALSPLRDLEVQEQTLERLGPDDPAITKVARELSKKRKRTARSLKKSAGRFHTERSERALIRCAERVELHAATPSAARVLTLAAVARRYATFDRRRRASENADRHALHRVRVAFKRYRYAVEIASPLLPAHAKGVIESMKRFQDELGAIQDASVLIETLTRANPAKRRAGAKTIAPALLALGLERDRKVEHARGALRAQLAAKPPAFSEPFESEAPAMAPPAVELKAPSKRRKKRSKAR